MPLFMLSLISSDETTPIFPPIYDSLISYLKQNKIMSKYPKLSSIKG